MTMKEFNKIYNEDCFKNINEIPNVDLILTSPPFYDNDVDIPYYKWLDAYLTTFLPKCKIMIMFNSSRRIIDICKKTNPKEVLIWNKKVGMGAYRYEPIFIYQQDTNIKLWGRGHIWADCISIVPIVGSNQKCKYQNPYTLYEQLLRYFPMCETILDTFIGSGTTAIACINQKRKYIGFEKNTDVYNICNENINNYKRLKTPDETEPLENIVGD